jgi:hypothetical protein
MMRAENNLKLIPTDVVGFFMGIYVCIPPISYRTHKLVRGQQDLLPIVALYNFKFLLCGLEPVIDIHWLHSVRSLAAWSSKNLQVCLFAMVVVPANIVAY